MFINTLIDDGFKLPSVSEVGSVMQLREYTNLTKELVECLESMLGKYREV